MNNNNNKKAIIAKNMASSKERLGLGGGSKISLVLTSLDRYHDHKEWKLKFTDIETQRHVVRAIAAFIDCISSHTSRHSLLKESVADIVKALVWILQDKNESIISLAADVVVKLLNRIPNSILLPYVSNLVPPLSPLLSSHQVDVSITCGTALHMILSNLSAKKEKEVYEMMKDTDIISCIVRNIKKFSNGSLPIEYFIQMAFLLSTILWQRPASRYYVWTDAVLMRSLETIREKPELSGNFAVLKIYSALALCGHAAKKLVENESLLQYMVHCIGSSQPISTRAEGLRLAQHLMRDKHGVLKLMNCCCEPLVEAIICGMTGWDLNFGKLSSDNMSFLERACRLALIITRWEGKHHTYFWKKGIGSILFALIEGNLHLEVTQHSSYEILMSMAQKYLKANFLLDLRPYIWDILGWLAAHCEEDFDRSIHGHEMHVRILIMCACLGFAETLHRGQKIFQTDVSDTLKDESVSRVVMLMIYSPCKYISSTTMSILSYILELNGEEYLQRLLRSVNLASSGQMGNTCQIMISIMCLTCLSGLPQYKMRIIECRGVKKLMAFVRWCISLDVCFGRLSFATHLLDLSSEKTCCWVYTEEWEGKDDLLFYGLWGLLELLQNSDSTNNSADAELVSIFQEIYSKTSAPGPKWYSAYILSYFGFYGFPNQLANKIGKALNEEEFADLQFIHPSGVSLSAHCVVLAVRCPSLLPSEKLMLNENKLDDSCERFQKKVRLSPQVEYQAMIKLLEFLYCGHFQAGEELVKKLKVLAKRCNLHSLSQILSEKRPKWGSPIPSSDLAHGLSSSCHKFCDFILEAKGDEPVHWNCSVCSILVPHMHVHKVVLWSSCDYMRALFDSGMEESQSKALKVPVSWEAMIKLVEWFYTNKLPNPPSGCLWANMNNDEKLRHLKPYVELSWLAEYWFVDEVYDGCYNVISTYLEDTRQLSINIIQIAASYSQWNLAEVAATYMAPLYGQLRDSGALDTLDEELVKIVRAASVRLSQDSEHNY
ncbi:hypothetical protein ACFE04_024875 [Oxalis oulophora]